MDFLDSEIFKVWQLLEKNKTIYIMVGGFATTFHGFSRVTQDLDLWIKDTLENRKSLRNVIKELDIGDFEGIETSEFIPGYTSIKLNSGIELDIMTYLKGFEQVKFDECYSIAPVADIDGVSIKFLHINQLIEAKKAAGRAKDLMDLEELEKIRNAQNKK
ncbi:hypothetical protein [Sediminibacterium sp.]|uniref:hypothetical protein n=1 Tax=Sediminibacterium sp. TaxID=1917865 RepID=UPI0027234CEC|nr:hypothetical protein [Sediminibacterium sp.]MDO9000291.1 hypothetical protein [Bacteroidota bacterium]MDP3147140.1 hypothetical protein [Bacteroidota bacterium]MDP3567330.1 hypothetical protein [Sediminibacterium sp.]